MDRAAADHVEQVVAGLLEVQHLGHQLGVLGGDLDTGVDTHEVGGVQERHVEHMALDPLAAVEQPPERSDLSAGPHFGDRLDRVRRAHLVGDRADPTDAGGDVDRFGPVAAAQKGLEVAGRLVDLELHLLDDPVADRHVHGALALDTGEGRHAEVEGPSRCGRS